MRAVNAAIHTLAADSRDAVVRHLLGLTDEDRRLRFGTLLDDDALRRYAASIDFARDRVTGLFEAGDRFVGLAHVRLDWRRDTAWAGLSVAPASRGRGYGYMLLCIAVLEARRAGCSSLALPGLAQNHIVRHLARKTGLSIIDASGGRCAYLATHGC